MAARAQIEGKRNTLVDGHEIQYSDFLPISANPVLHNFDRSFTFLCSELPTSWAFRVKFCTEPNDCSVSCQVFIKRADQSWTRMDVDFWIQAIPGFLVDLPYRSFKIRGMQGGHQENRTLDAVIPYEVLRQLVDRQPMFLVTFSVHGCHGDGFLKRLLGSASKATENREPAALHSNL